MVLVVLDNVGFFYSEISEILLRLGSVLVVSYPNFVWGLSFIDLLIFASRLMVLNASYSVKQMIIQCFDQECKKYKKKGAKGSFC